MKINFPIITERLELSLRHEAYAGQFLEVWVNAPPRVVSLVSKAMRRKVEEGATEAEVKQAEEDHKAGVAALSELWSQGKEEQARMSVSDIEEFVEASRESDPALYNWLIVQSLQMILDFKGNIKKNS